MRFRSHSLAIILVFSALGCIEQAPQLTIEAYNSSLPDGFFVENNSIVYNGRFWLPDSCHEIEPSVNMISGNITFTFTVKSISGVTACDAMERMKPIKVSYGPLPDGNYAVFLHTLHPNTGIGESISGPYNVSVSYAYWKYELVTGDGIIRGGNSFDFDNNKTYESGNIKGDVWLNHNPIPPGMLGIPERPLTLDKGLAIAIYDAGLDTTVDCRNVTYSNDLAKITLLRAGESVPIKTGENINRTICIKTDEGNYAKMILLDSFNHFGYELYKKIN